MVLAMILLSLSPFTSAQDRGGGSGGQGRHGGELVDCKVVVTLKSVTFWVDNEAWDDEYSLDVRIFGRATNLKYDVAGGTTLPYTVAVGKEVYSGNVLFKDMKVTIPISLEATELDVLVDDHAAGHLTVKEICPGSIEVSGSAVSYYSSGVLGPVDVEFTFSIVLDP